MSENTLMLDIGNEKPFPVELHLDRYMDGNLYIGLYDMSNGYAEYLCDITKNLGEVLHGPYALIDTNNAPFVEQFIKQYNLGEPYMGIVRSNGFCAYPLYRFNEERLQDLCPDGYASIMDIEEREV